MIRRKLPKGTDFGKLTKADIKDAEEWINNYPRKILGYRSSNRAFDEELKLLGISV